MYKALSSFELISVDLNVLCGMETDHDDLNLLLKDRETDFEPTITMNSLPSNIMSVDVFHFRACCWCPDCWIGRRVLCKILSQ